MELQKVTITEFRFRKVTEGHQIKEKAPTNLCKCLIIKVDQPVLEPGTSRL